MQISDIYIDWVVGHFSFVNLLETHKFLAGCLSDQNRCYSSDDFIEKKQKYITWIDFKLNRH